MNHPDAPSLVAVWPPSVSDWLGREDRSPLLVVDSHTCGNPTRILLAGLDVPADVSTVAQTRRWLRDEADWVRTRLVHEPRGGGLTCAVVPVLGGGEGADLGAVILEPGSYPPMCGHCMIGYSAVAAELGLVCQPAFTIMTPAGIVHSRVERDPDGRNTVTLTNVDSYLVSSRECVLSAGQVDVDLVYGGDYYLTVDADKLGLQLERAEAATIVGLADEIRRSVQEDGAVDPETGAALDVYQVMFFRRLAAARARVVVVAPPGVIDRSPCGTGSSALLALLYTRDAAEALVTESIIGSEFRLAVAGSARDGSRVTVSPKLSGTAHINGFLTIVADRLDELKDGFPPL